MKALFILCITILLSINSYSQCNFWLWAPPGCDTICNKYIYVWPDSSPGVHYIFVDGIYHSSINGIDSIGPFCPGNYSIIITDSMGCNFTDGISITGSPINISFTIQNPSCPTCSDGSVTATYSGGAQPWGYYLIWSNGVYDYSYSTSTIDSLTAGVYCVTAEDSIGCTATACEAIGFGSGFSVIQGLVYLDIDTNGVHNPLETGLGNIQVQANPGGYSTWSDNNGTYFMVVPNGNYTVSVIPPNNWIQTSLPVNYNVALSDTLIYGNDFGLLPDTTIASAQLLLTADIPRCNWYSSYTISYTNTSLMLADGEVIFNMDPLVTFNNALPPPANIVGNTYTWNFTNLYPFQPQNIIINVTMPPLQGTILNSSAIINLYDNASNIIFTDSVYKTQTVTCSWDPNDKIALPEGIGSQNVVPLNSVADYTIRFQNTGTDTAFVVMIKDTLSTLLDLSTFEFLAASHEVNTQLNQDGVLTFTFYNILLPDSNINQAASHGFARYRIRPLAPVADPTTITNTAYIFFDQNPVVITNSTLTTFSDNLLSVTELNGSEIKVYPNPFTDELNINFENDTNALIKVYDFTGRIVISKEIRNSENVIINRGNLKAGIYLINIITSSGNTSFKLIAN